MKTISVIFSVILAIFLAPGFAFAQDDSMAELQKRFKERYPKIQQLKTDGVVGETDDGFLEFVDKKDANAKTLMEAENKDRKALYKLIADKEGVEPDVVAKRNAKRNFEKAKAGEFLRESGKWRKKT